MGRIATMARPRHAPEQIIGKLSEADRLLAEGAGVAEITRQLEISDPNQRVERRRLSTAG